MITPKMQFLCLEFMETWRSRKKLCERLAFMEKQPMKMQDFKEGEVYVGKRFQNCVCQLENHKSGAAGGEDGRQLGGARCCDIGGGEIDMLNSAASRDDGVKQQAWK